MHTNRVQTMSVSHENFQIQKKLAAITTILFVIKIVAWYLTNSVAILTDALEYTVNLIAGFIGLYSLYLSAQPRDENHPYGHGKVEFLSAAVEGTLMVVSGLLIVYEAINNFRNPHTLSQLDYGIILVAITAAVNYGVGAYSIKNGKKNNSLALVATGKHMQTDTYATMGILVGLGLIFFTGQVWLDSVVAVIFACLIMLSGYSILRQSIAGMMDEADQELLAEMVKLFNRSRRPNWVDMHDLRVIKYGSTLHLDCHLTVPWYFNVNQAHDEVDQMALLVRENFGESVELFVHNDGCLDFSCQICEKQDCTYRQAGFVERVEWTVENISKNSKHHIEAKI